ncbi:MAG: hypothetical protein KDH89_06575 [Anaerolineae bacterium]|nr:hypothetical protein [Anaerolineae bacterium]
MPPFVLLFTISLDIARMIGYNQAIIQATPATTSPLA